jgi:hypothetical protein
MALAELIKRCWAAEPADRPCGLHIVQQLEVISLWEQTALCQVSRLSTSGTSPSCHACVLYVLCVCVCVWRGEREGERERKRERERERERCDVISVYACAHVRGCRSACVRGTCGTWA